jgi:hypothetical protein
MRNIAQPFPVQVRAHRFRVRTVLNASQAISRLDRDQAALFFDKGNLSAKHKGAVRAFKSADQQ